MSDSQVPCINIIVSFLNFFLGLSPITNDVVVVLICSIKQELDS